MIRIGIICPSEIAFRRFLPALKLVKDFNFAAIGIACAEEWYGKGKEYDKEAEKARLDRETTKAQEFIDAWGGGEIIEGYQNLVYSEEIDAVYLPLPPALHYKWAKIALERGNHVFVEKPSTTDAADTNDLIELARMRGLALYENYMFIYHDQLKALNDVVASGEIGDIRLYRISFGFPRRAQNDFRYNKALGGGALIDAGGYTIKYASYLLGPTAKLTTAHLNYLDEFDVDMYGSATMVNNKGVTAQLAFGMDNDYKCEIEIWGSKGTMTSNRILTAPAGFEPEYTIKKNQEFEYHKLPVDDAFKKSIERFRDCIENPEIQEDEYRLVGIEAKLMTDFKKLAINRLQDSKIHDK
ncbi:MAG: Gfo/Idh/MocA family oxidoreductase [Bacteroidales bacterium]|nr:Gfo/Idh/MocA family oxidoreductase [Bacteroidales bacterium]